MNKKDLKEKFEKSKKWCKDHAVAIGGVVGGTISIICMGVSYKFGRDSALSEFNSNLDKLFKNAASMHFKERITPRDLMCDDAIKITEESDGTE
jgi:hypothetical protein